jgi:hypothetical protein
MRRGCASVAGDLLGYPIHCLGDRPAQGVDLLRGERGDLDLVGAGHSVVIPGDEDRALAAAHLLQTFLEVLALHQRLI